MIGPDAARGLLRNEGWLSHTPERFRDAVLSKATLKRYAAGATIVTVGEEPRGLFGLAEGGLRVAIAPADSGPLFAHFFQPGSWFGEVPALTGQHYVVALAAARETTLLHLSNHALNDILREDPSCWRYLGQLAVTHLETAMGLVADLMRRDHTKRFTAILMQLAGCRNSVRAGTASPVDIDFSQEDLATIANLARTTVNGILNQLQENRIVDLSYRRIRILDPEKMRTMIAD